MENNPIRGYLRALERELRGLGLAQPETLQEIESHLLDSVEQGLRQGLSPAEAQQRALERFGPPRLVAQQFDKESKHTMQKILLAAALGAGLLIAYVDSRPHWDDTGITVLALLISGGIIGLLLRRRPWLYALALGLWMPVLYIARTHDPRFLAILLIAFVGTYVGWGLRTAVRKARQGTA